jgi:hypothetical protein
MQVYDTQDDMDKKEYRPANSERGMQAAWALILDPRPLVHELGSIPLETVRKVLYKLYAHNFEAPEGFTLGRDVLLLSVIIGEPRQLKTKVLSEVLKSLGVFEGAGAYYVVIDTSLDRPTLHAGAYIEDGLDTLLTIAALVREQAPLADERSLAQKLADERYIELETQGYIEYCEQLEKRKTKEHLEQNAREKLLDEAWRLAIDEEDLERLKQLLDDTLELAKTCEDDYMIEVWDSRSHELTELVQLRESVAQA